MMNEEKLLAVARYLEGDMEHREKTEFEFSIQEDPELQGMLAEYKNVHQTLKMRIAPSEADAKVEATLASLNKEYFKDETSLETKTITTPKIISMKPYLKWISVAAILVIGLLVWAPWSAGLYEKYAISKEMSVVERGEDNKNSLEKAADFYNSGDFISASDILQKEYADNPDNSMVAYYYGVSLIETGKTVEARTVLTKIYDGASVFKYDAAYYMALSYIKEKNNQEAIAWLEKIPSGTSNFDQAQDLIKKL
jgi:tetratricopeptide (TPR) repeat protein